MQDAFERALGAIRARVSVSGSRIAVAFSGGLDSSALLHLAREHARASGVELFAFHVHHGLSEHADQWQRHCETECAAIGVRFEARRVTLADVERDGIEQAARLRRYAALGELCRGHDVSLLLTAHHLDDQAETVLLQLLRGSGVAGMAAMEEAVQTHALLGGPTPALGRPLLGTTREVLERYVSENGIRFILDESNEDLRFPRNALRHRVMPALARHFPGFQSRLARAAGHARSAERLLAELAAQDMAACAHGSGIDLGCLRALSEERQANLLRYWFASRGFRRPSTAWLAQLRAQLLSAAEDAQLRVTHPDCEVRRFRGRALLVPRPEVNPLPGAGRAFLWKGEASIAFPEFGGVLHFERGDGGVDADWLMQQNLQILPRRGGERLKVAPDRPTRSLKHHYQALAIPAWERPRLPIVLASGRLLFAAGVGMNCKEVPFTAATAMRLRWETDGC